MAWIEIEWQLTVEKQNDYDDEPGLRFAIVTINDGMVDVHDHSTGKLTRGSFETPPAGGDVWSGRISSSRAVPTDIAPYFGVAVQAFEHVFSRSDERRVDDKSFGDSVMTVCQAVVDSGGIPELAVLAAAANAPRLVQDRSDCDDWIGASTWVDVDYGRRIAPGLALEHRNEIGEVIRATGSQDRQLMRFPYGDAVYELEWERRIIAGPLNGKKSEFSMHAWSNASWVH